MAVTKILPRNSRLDVAIKYVLNGEKTDTMPFPSVLSRCKPVFETMKGWQSDITGIRTWWDLPEEAKDYVNLVERAVGRPFVWISVGPERESIILRG